MLTWTLSHNFNEQTINPEKEREREGGGHVSCLSTLNTRAQYATLTRTDAIPLILNLKCKLRSLGKGFKYWP